MEKRVRQLIKLNDYKKRFKKIMMTFFLILGIPVATSFILGYEMQAKQIQHIPTAIIDEDRSAFSRMLIDEIRTNEIFNVTNYCETNDEMKTLIENNKARVGVIIPASFSKDLKEGKGPKVLILYDDAQMSITGAAKSRMSEILLTLKTGFLKKIAEGKLNSIPDEAMHNALPMYFSYRLLNNPTKDYTSFMLPGMLVAVLQVGFVMLGVDRIRKEEKYFTWILFKGLFWGLFGAISIIITMDIQFKYFAMPYKGTVQGGLILTLLFAVGIIGLGILVRLLIPNDMIATQVGAILVLPSSILGGYTYPIMAMPLPLQKLATYIPFVHYAEPLRDLCVKPIGMEYILKDIYWLSKFALLMWSASFIVFFAKKFTKKAYLKYSSNREKKITTEVVL